ncbi:MAG: deacetylase [Firmicutes bacterium]|nr:deacetylase [Bacillota bacterium]
MRKLLIVLLIILLAGCRPGTEPVTTDKKLPIYSVAREDNKLAISFDAAWGIEYTEQILDTLDEYGIKTTFFVVQFWVEDYPEMAQMIVNRGHEIGNHSATHPEMGNLSPTQIKEEIMSTHKTIYETTGFEPCLFRPPFGHYSDQLLETMEDLGYYTIQWDVDSLDWKERGVEDIVQRVQAQAGPGSIILFHNNAKYIAQALPLLLDYFSERDYHVVPISELIYKNNYYIDHEGRQHKK